MVGVGWFGLVRLVAVGWACLMLIGVVDVDWLALLGVGSCFAGFDWCWSGLLGFTGFGWILVGVGYLVLVSVGWLSLVLAGAG